MSKVGYAHNGKAYRGYAKTDAPDAAKRVLKASVRHPQEGESHRSELLASHGDNNWLQSKDQVIYWNYQLPRLLDEVNL